jgi:REP element-mobilizing transposase RayT
MARPLRIEFPGGVYHLTSRGDRCEPIFADDKDRACLIGILAQAMERFDAMVLAYCLMGNHYHFVLQTRRENLSRLMRHVNGVYAQAFNRRHGLVGHLFQGRFTSIHVDRDAYLMEVCRYTELNPVRARMVDAPADWPWSSYRAHCGLAASPRWLDTAALHGYLLGHDARTVVDRLRAAELYVELVANGRGVRLWDHSLRQDIYLGDDAFIEQTQERARRRESTTSEIPKAQRSRPKLVPRSFGSGDARDESLRLAYVEGGMSMSEIAKAAGLSISRVSRLIARLEERLGQALRANGQVQPADSGSDTVRPDSVRAS